MQAIELEERQEELTEAGEEARAQRDELSATAGQLALTRSAGRSTTATFADALAADATRACWPGSRCRDLVEAAGRGRRRRCTRETWRDDGALDARWRSVGLDPALLSEHVAAGGEGVARAGGRAA